MEILGFDIAKALTPDKSLFETVIRGAVMYGAVFLLLRVLLRGRAQGLTTGDLIVLVLIADAAQNAMAAEYHSLTNGIVLVGTIVVSSYLLDWLGYHVPAVERRVHPPAKPLIVNGRIIRRTLERELMTEEELMTQIRLAGVERVEEVKAAYIEGNDEISVIKREEKDSGTERRQDAKP